MKKMMMTLVAVLMVSLTVMADDKDKKFSPEKFQADLEAFIAREAGLTDDEAARFFPVYRELGQRQRKLFAQQHQMGKLGPKGDEACRAAIEQSDRMELEMKQLQQQYHRRFMEILSAEKVYNILRAETRFHRRALYQGGAQRPMSAGDKQGRHGKRGGKRD